MMKLRKIISAVLSLIMTFTALPINKIMAQETKINEYMFLYDAESNTNGVVPDSLSKDNFEIKNYAKKGNSLKLLKSNTAHIPMKTINKGRAIFEIEMRPENEAVQNLIFKNSEGKNLFVIAAKANNADELNTKALYIAKEKVKKQVEGENTSEIVNISNSSPSKSWIKLKVEFNFDETKYSENNILYYDISASSTQESDYTSKWTDGGHITQQNIIDIGSTVSDSVYKNGTVENIEIFDLSSISMWATSSKFIGDISLKNEYLVAKAKGTQKLGQEFDISLIELKKVYNDGTEAAETENSEIISLETLESKEYEIINFDKNKNGKQNIIIKYDGLYAPVTIEVTGNSTGTESENIIFSYDGENNENHTLPKELSNLQIYEKDGKYGYAGKDNALRFKESKKITNIPINGTINKNTAVFELEMYPGGKTTQNVVFKNSEGKILFVIGNDTNDGKTGSYYISNDVPDKVGDEEKIEKILILREFTKKTWVKLKVEIDFTNSLNGVLKYKISTSTSPNADKYDKSVDNWTDVLEVTQDKLIDKGYTNGTVSTDISKLDLESIEFYPIEKQFIGDISLKILESEEITLKNTIVDKENKVTKTRYKIGENLSLAIKEEYSDGSTKTITDMAYIKNNYDLSGFDTNKLGKQKITLTHKIKSGIVIELEVEVIEVTITGINVEQGEVKTAYKAGEKIDVSNIVVKALYDGGSISLGSDEYVAVPSIETAVTGTSQITVTVIAKGHKAECTYDITVEEVKLTKITISKEKLFHRVGEKLEKGDLKVKGTFAFSDGTGTSTRELEEREFELGEFDSTEIGMKKVKVRAGDVEDSVNIIVVIPSTTKMLYNLFKYTQAEEKEGQTAGDLGILSGAEIVTVSDGIKENTTQMLEVSGKAEKKMDISISEGVVKIITVFNQNSKDVSYKVMDKDGNTLISISQPFEIKEEKEKGVLKLVEENPTDGEKGYLEKDNLVNRWIKLETEIDLDKSNSSGVLNFLTKIYQKKNYTDEWTEKNFVSTANYQESSFKNDNGCATAGITEFNVGSVIFGASEASVYFDDIEISATDFPKPTGVTIKTKPDKFSYKKGDSLDLTGLVITETYSSGESRDISDLDYIKEYYLVSGLNATDEKQTVTLRYKTNQEISAKFDVTVDLLVELTEIKVETLKKEYFIGDEILASDIEVKAIYSNESEEVLKKGFIISQTVLDKIGDNKITVTVGEKTGTFTVNVKDFVESAKITKLPEKTEYMAGDKIDFSGIQVTAVYKSGKESILERTAYKIDSDIKEVKSDTKSINMVIKLNNEKGTEVKAEESYSITVKIVEENPVEVKEKIFGYDGETTLVLPKELENYFSIVKSGGKTNALRFLQKDTLFSIPMKTISKDTAVFELEMFPASKTSQSAVFKNSNGETLFVIANSIADGETGTLYITDTKDGSEIVSLGTFAKNSWVKVKVEIDVTNSFGNLNYKISATTYSEIGKYKEDYSKWNNLGEVTQDALIAEGYTNATVTAGISKFDLGSVEIASAISNRWIGDISLYTVESRILTAVDLVNESPVICTKGGSLNLSVKEIYDNESEETRNMAYIKNNYDISGFDTNKLGKQKITLTHKIKSDIVIELEVEVIEVTITGINVEQGEVKTAYKAGEKIDVSNIVVKALYDGGSISLGSDEYVAVPSIETAVTGTSQITVTVIAKGHKAECTYDITVEEVKLTKITISKEKLFHRVGEKLEKGDLKVKGTFAFSDGTGTSTRELEEREFELGEFDSTEIGMKKVKVRAGDVEDSVNIIVVIPSTTKMLYNLFKYTQAEEKEGQTAGDLGILSGAEIVTVSDGIKENTTQMLEVSGKAEKKMDISISEGVVKIITVFNQNSKDVSYKVMDKDGNTLISISQPFEIKEEKEKGVLKLVEENPTDGEKGYLEKDNLVNRWIKLETEIDLDKSNSSGVLNFLTKIYQKKNYTDEWTEKNFVSTANYQESSFKNDNGCATAGITEFNVGSVIFGASEASVYFDDIEISATDFPKPTGVTIKTKPDKFSYKKGDSLDLTGLVITETYSSGESRDISDLDYIKEYYLVSGLNATDEKQTVTLRYKTNQEISAKFDVTVDLLVELTEIKVETLKKEYFIGDEILASDIEVKAIYSNESEEVLKKGFIISQTVLDKIGDNKITVTVGEKTGTFTVNVKDFVESAKITKLPEKTEYMAGDKIDFSGIQVTAVYKSGKESILERTAYKIDSDIKEVKSDTKSINMVIKLNNEKGTEVKAEESYSIIVKAMEEKPNIPNEPEKPSDDEDTESTDDENSNDNLNVEENLKLDGDIIDKIMENLDNFSENKIFEFVVNDKLELFKEAVNKLAEAGKDLKIKLKGTDIILNNKFLYSNGIKNNLNITIDKLSENELKDIKKQIKLDDTLEYIQSDKISIKSEGNEVDLTNKEPLTVVVKIAEIEDADKLTAIRYEKQEDGSFKVVKIGGVYDKNTQTFTYHTDKTGIIAIVKAENTKQINLTIGNNKMIVNGKEFVNDISPIVENNRTYLPIRVIAEKLGAKVSWEQKTQSVTVTLDGKTLRFNVNEEITGYGKPIVKNQRTLVPVRYISEKLGANVLWIPSLNEVEIVK